MPAATDWAALGYKSGQAQAERDGAYYDPQWGYVVNGLEDKDDADGAQKGARVDPSCNRQEWTRCVHEDRSRSAMLAE